MQAHCWRCNVVDCRVYCGLYSVIQEKDQTYGLVLGVVNIMGQGKSQVHSMDSYFHHKHSRPHRPDLLPALGLYQPERPSTSIERHLPQTETSIHLVTSQHNRIHLGSSIPQGLMYLSIIKLVNFIISGSATQWYLQEQENGLCLTFTRMIKYHFGSIVGGSFLNAFFNLIDFVF